MNRQGMYQKQPNSLFLQQNSAELFGEHLGALLLVRSLYTSICRQTYIYMYIYVDGTLIALNLRPVNKQKVIGPGAHEGLAHKGPAQKGPGRPIRARPIMAQGRP